MKNSTATPIATSRGPWLYFNASGLENTRATATMNAANLK
jgi:hypothetical protein